MQRYFSCVEGTTEPGLIAKPLDEYLAIIKSFESSDQKKSEFEAQALHEAIGCLRSLGGNACRGDIMRDDSIAREKRQAWFIKLHHKYPNSKWTKKTPLFW